MRASEIFEVEADYRFLGRRFDQLISELWSLASDDPQRALRKHYGMHMRCKNGCKIST